MFPEIINLPQKSDFMIRIIADDKIPFLKGVLEPFADIKYFPGNKITHEVLKHADGLIIRTRTKCTHELLDDTSVRFIGTATIGFDHIDTQFCERKNIYWTNAPGCNSSSVQQYIAAALLKISSEFRFNLKNKSIGIIGVGNVGSKVEKFARIMGMKILLCDPPRARNEGDANFTQLDNLLRKSDIVTVHVPLNVVGEDNTYHLFNETTFKKMKKGAWFLNSSRGEITETSALKNLLISEISGGTVIDVWENEPDIDPELLTKTFIATPHIAGYSTDGKANGTAMVVNSLCKFFNLPLENWYPADVPLPFNPDITIDAKDKSDEEIMREAVFHTYNIEEDDKKFRFSPADFEKQRGNYRLRREFQAYNIRLINNKKSILKLLEALGFNVRSGSDPGN